jgi:hypothetical protein
MRSERGQARGRLRPSESLREALSNRGGNANFRPRILETHRSRNMGHKLTRSTPIRTTAAAPSRRWPIFLQEGGGILEPKSGRRVPADPLGVFARHFPAGSARVCEADFQADCRPETSDTRTQTISDPLRLRFRGPSATPSASAPGASRSGVFTPHICRPCILALCKVWRRLATLHRPYICKVCKWRNPLSHRTLERFSAC